MSSVTQTIAVATAEERAAIVALEWRRYAAMLVADTATLSHQLAEPFIYTHSSGFQDDRRAFLEKLESGRYVFHSVDHDVEAVVRLGSVFIAHGRMAGIVEVDGRQRAIDNLSLAIWSGVDADAQLVAYSSTSRPQAVKT